MKVILFCLGVHAYRRLLKRLPAITDAPTRIRYQIILNLDAGMSAAEVGRALNVSRGTVYRVLHRFLLQGEAGLEDGRKHNGHRKVDQQYRDTLCCVVASCPLTHDWRRPTWTQEMLVDTLHKLRGVRVSRAVMSRALASIQARRGRPKPIVRCPWTPQRKGRRLAEIRRLVAHLPPDEVAFFEDEVDLHLNPKIGLDWMAPGQQKTVLTPGVNEKRYLAGARDVRTGEIVWVEDERKDSILFLRLLWELTQRHPDARHIHVILDNYGIHGSHQVQRALCTAQGQRIVLHFLPPYCPDHNKIERDWEDLHAEVTRNHRCATMEALMEEVRRHLDCRNRRFLTNSQALAA